MMVYTVRGAGLAPATPATQRRSRTLRLAAIRATKLLCFQYPRCKHPASDNLVCFQ